MSIIIFAKEPVNDKCSIVAELQNCWSLDQTELMKKKIKKERCFEKDCFYNYLG